ncbi:hypothetical protein Glove_209g178 [Diversispora epigaea]|uniref:Uncharacterized protein n=1 Tax=Diversispora epigaea TaxID=1348612 RepID=A0A397IIK9_9GLOM|nr:hypothetical protein Glove_209g178 [Diversispora epigaea]
MSVEIRIRQITEVIRFLTEKIDFNVYSVEGNWFCQHPRCKHELKCRNEIECQNECPHEPQCQTKMQCQTKWQCQHNPVCKSRLHCRRKWTCRHYPICQSKSYCKSNWRCKHQPQCQHLYECKYRWTEKYEPRCQAKWKCCHKRKCKTKLECQNKPFQVKWKCLHGYRCQDKWKCQNRWQCQHKEKCDTNLKCQAKCQHQCENKMECLKKSQTPEHQHEDEWKCLHQCEDIRECQKKWKCIHDEPECSKEEQCQIRGWGCPHEQPCLGGCKGKWDEENEWNCSHIGKRQSTSKYVKDSNRSDEGECQSYWQCIIDPQYQNKWQCQGNWTKIYSQNELKNALRKTPQQLYDFFTKRCKECNADSLIVSFRILEGPQKILKEEIICHLVWTKAKKTKGEVFYRVFGQWECDRKIKHRWPSSYTWISLRKYYENSQTGFQARNFSKQECHICYERELTSYGSITFWKRILASKDGPQHKRELCEKCKSREFCVQTNSYFGR